MARSLFGEMFRLSLFAAAWCEEPAKRDVLYHWLV